VPPGENTFSHWRRLARVDRAAGEFAARLQAAPAAARSTAVAWVDSDLPRAWARAAEGPLRGVPFLVKDLYDMAGVPTRAGSTFLERERTVPAADSALVRRLRELGAVPVAKTQLNEFAYGATGENAHSGDCFQIPHPDRLTGGSSSGSAWGVQAGIAPLALGTDTGCSVRVPAAFCRLWGMRLSPAHWTITDVFPLAPSFDSAGWFTANAADMAEMFTYILGPTDAKQVSEGSFVSLADLGEHEPAMDAALVASAKRISQPASPRVVRIVRDSVERSLAAYTVIVACEALAVHRPFIERRAEDYDPVVLARLKRAMEYTASDEAAARATISAVGTMMCDAIAEAGSIVMPVSPVPALLKSQSDDAHRSRILRLNTPASLAGLPVLTIPVSLRGGLSGGLQVITASLESAALGAFSAALS
jgi:amidase/aspartyl-tRNA(Asn)/glutamyl-tRNA(Gln) amidotransferase subunit A